MSSGQTSSEKLLQAAEDELIADNGQMEMSAVAQRAGLSVGLAYHHFGSKAGLVAAVVDRFYEPLREISLGRAIPPTLDWETRNRPAPQPWWIIILTILWPL